MAKIVKFQIQDGKVIEGEEVGFKPLEEPWCVYQLEDGHQVRMKLIVTQIVRTSERDADGNPVYVARSSNVMAVSPPDTFRKREIQ